MVLELAKPLQLMLPYFEGYETMYLIHTNMYLCVFVSNNYQSIPSADEVVKIQIASSLVNFE